MSIITPPATWEITFGREAVARQKRSGDRGLPWGTPCLNTLKELLSLFHQTAALLSDSHDRIHLRSAWGASLSARSSRRPLLHTRSKAALKSTPTMIVRSFLCRASNDLCETLASTSSVLLPGWKPA